ncbi:uncharacterized protein BCR38DRAFT_90661 [Pseudomassariella vexata]|uniref:RRM domain-containing protein n=1 Tax=Pseudomassariella vexata TaxID=1141098 RepID=A0A1Y2EE81_9PEZI|nr:uncharacterized protein BCR38DRAFT_90661 [Pseudomassariella vexata]ORY69707.1 hypothetical protein BCR38DRAFT_90661 [Pseudomassariella vexata]
MYITSCDDARPKIREIIRLIRVISSQLPWNTSWQQLKDHVRTVCSVERVEVFNDSTSGWVMVRGHDSYNAALQLLSGGLFNGRPTFADGRNATQSIMIKELVVPSTMAVPSPRSSRTPIAHAPPSAQYSSAYSPPTSPPATYTADYGQWTSAAPTAAAYVTSPTTDYSPHMATPYDYGEAPGWYPYDGTSYVDQSSVIPATVQYPYDAYQQAPQYDHLNGYGGTEYGSSGNAPVRESRHAKSPIINNSSAGFVKTERRKIIIKGLTSWTSLDQIKELLRTKAGSDADKNPHINLPVSEEGGIRGYATITFRSEEVASKIVKRLNKATFNGREIKVELTKEGVSRNEEHHAKSSHHQSSHHHSSRHHREDRERSGREDRERSGKKENSKASTPCPVEKKDKSQSKRGVVIANGSSKNPKASDWSKKSG